MSEGGWRDGSACGGGRGAGCTAARQRPVSAGLPLRPAALRWRPAWFVGSRLSPLAAATTAAQRCCLAASPPRILCRRSVLETSEELRAALVQGLDTLVAVSYVDDDEVRCCCFLFSATLACILLLWFGWARWWPRRTWTTRRWALLAAVLALILPHTAAVLFCCCALVWLGTLAATCDTPQALAPFFHHSPQVFKICLEYWNFFVPDVYSSVCTIEPASQAAVAAVSRARARACACMPPACSLVQPAALSGCRGLRWLLLLCAGGPAEAAGGRAAAPGASADWPPPRPPHPHPAPHPAPALRAVFFRRCGAGGAWRHGRGAQDAVRQDARPAAGADDCAHGKARGGGCWLHGSPARRRVGLRWLTALLCGSCSLPAGVMGLVLGGGSCRLAGREVGRDGRGRLQCTLAPPTPPRATPLLLFAGHCG